MAVAISTPGRALLAAGSSVRVALYEQPDEPFDHRPIVVLHGNLWNRLIPERAPQIVVRAADEQDVIAAVRFARDHRLKVAVRGGGHNWSQPSLRHGGLLIDLMNLNKVISIDG
jgi:FAD/FMN-containing dehydrogenase